MTAYLICNLIFTSDFTVIISCIFAFLVAVSYPVVCAAVTWNDLIDLRPFPVFHNCGWYFNEFFHGSEAFLFTPEFAVNSLDSFPEMKLLGQIKRISWFLDPYCQIILKASCLVNLGGSYSVKGFLHLTGPWRFWPGLSPLQPRQGSKPFLGSLGPHTPPDWGGKYHVNAGTRLWAPGSERRLRTCLWTSSAPCSPREELPSSSCDLPAFPCFPH